MKQGRPQITLNDSDRIRVLRLIQRGYNLRDQARQLGCSPWTLLRAKHAWGMINPARSAARKACHVAQPRPSDRFSSWFADEILRGRARDRNEERNLLAAKAFVNTQPKPFWESRPAATDAECEAILQWALAHPGCAEWRKAYDKDAILSSGRKRKVQFGSKQTAWSEFS